MKTFLLCLATAMFTWAVLAVANVRRKRRMIRDLQKLGDQIREHIELERQGARESMREIVQQ